MSDTNPKLEVVYRKVGEIAISPRNARRHSDKQIVQIKASIAQFGFTNPVLIDENKVLIAGHGRLTAAQALKFDPIPTIQIAHLTELQKRALMLADNKIALNSSWDLEILSEELKVLSSPDLEIDVAITGFDTAEIDLIIDGAAVLSESDPADAIPAIDRSKPAITQPGDHWLLGHHRICCDTALESKGYEALLGGEKAQMVITDPPYNVKIDGHVSGLGQVRHRDFAMASGEMSPTQFTQFLQTVFGQLVTFTVDGSMHFVFMDWRHMAEILAAGSAAYTELKNLCVWNKSNGGMGSLYRSKHELVFAFKNGTASHINNVELGRHGRYRTNVWDYAGVNSFGRNRKADLETHPTVKPVALIADALKDCSHRNGLILDPFGGAGSTLLAAERTGRRACLIELDPHYVDATVWRWQKMTGMEAQRINCDTATHANAPSSLTENAQPPPEAMADCPPVSIGMTGQPAVTPAAPPEVQRWSAVT